MASLGLFSVPKAYAGPPDVPRFSGRGIHVVVLGAGIAGLVAAYELGKAGYACTLLEARQRLGGRNWTIRRGDLVRETGMPDQVCTFDSDNSLYFNAGPGRIPHHHRAILAYCRELGVPLEVHVLANRATLLQSDAALSGRPVRDRQVHHDTRGHVAELLAKAVRRHALDEELSAHDREHLLAMLKRFGDLQAKSLRYRGSDRAGYAVPKGAGTASGTLEGSLPLEVLLGAGFWRSVADYAEAHNYQATLLQPVGGMDQIIEAFRRALRRCKVVFGAEVHEVRTGDGDVTVAFRRRQREETLRAGFCVCTLPLPILARLDSNFPPAVKAVLARIRMRKAFKLAWQAEARFWEEEGIFGGISWTTHPITQVWYPSQGYLGRKGILVGAYNYEDQAEFLGTLDLEARRSIALQGGERLHPGFSRYVSRAVSVAWHKVPYSEGAWTSWGDERREDDYVLLQQPIGRVFLCGDHLSYFAGWQEGAVLSAQSAVAAIAARGGQMRSARRPTEEQS